MYYILILIILLFHRTWSNQPKRKRVKSEKAYAFIICIILVLLAAFRSDNVGADTVGYRNAYLAMGMFQSIQDIVDRHTYDYLVYYGLSKLFHMAGMPVQVWFGFVEALYLYALMRLVNKFSKDKIFSLLVFTTIGLFSFSLAGLKQTMSMSLMMLAFIGLMEKKYWLSALLIVLTYYTHQSAMIFLAAFPLYYVRKARWLIPATMGIFVLTYFYGFAFMETMVETIDNERWDKYLITDSGYSYVTFIFYLVITLVSGLNIKKYHAVDPSFSYLFFGLSILGCGLQLLAGISPSLFRLAYLYTPFMMILLPNVSYYSNNKQLVRTILIVCIVFYFLYAGRNSTYSFVQL